jgi:ABC-type dipeptide/oligopeptide/nickel transport system permease subunit
MRRSVWKRYKGNTSALIGAGFILVLTTIAIGGAYLRPDSSANANQQQLSIARLPMGSEVQVLNVSRYGIQDSRLFQGLLFGGLEQDSRESVFDSLTFEADKVVLMFKGSVTEKFLLAEVCFDLAQNTYSYTPPNIKFDAGSRSFVFTENELRAQVNNEYVLRKRFLLGTDSFGRDLLSRLMSGIIVSLSVGLISVLISLTIGILMGAIAGYFRGWVDEVVMWLINVIWSIPTLLMVIAITLVLGKGFVQVFIAVGLTMWVEVARIVRGQFISLRESAFVEAGRSMGFSGIRLMLKHMLPNAMGPVIVISAANFASAILIEAGLSFLGIGTQIPMASWGTMIKEHYGYITTDLAYLAYLPGLCITLMVLAFTLVGNGLRYALDVRS